MGDEPLIAAVDVGYDDGVALAAAVGFVGWDATEPVRSVSVRVPVVEPYVPGEFRRRELAPALAAIEALAAAVPRALDAVVIDGYVWLGRHRPGLGAFVHESLGGSIPVIGVAKNAFAGNDASLPIRRGTSDRPLFVTAIGTDAGSAALLVHAMAGAHRMPTMLKLADRLSRAS